MALYGEHRESLELDVHEFHQIRKCCSEYNVDLCVLPASTVLMHAKNLALMYKVASFDLGNIYHGLIASKIYLVISAGGGLIRHAEHLWATIKSTRILLFFIVFHNIPSRSIKVEQNK